MVSETKKKRYDNNNYYELSLHRLLITASATFLSSPKNTVYAYAGKVRDVQFRTPITNFEWVMDLL